MGNCDVSVGEARPLIPRDPDPDNTWIVAETLAFCGEAAHARKLVRDVSARFPSATTWNATIVPNVGAALELRRDQPARALDLLSAARPDFATRYLRGTAQLRLGHGAEAAAAFQDILDRKGADPNTGRPGGAYGLFHAAAHLGVARATAMAGDTDKARNVYQDFFDLWKDADPDLTMLRDARREYAALR